MRALRYVFGVSTGAVRYGSMQDALEAFLFRDSDHVFVLSYCNKAMRKVANVVEENPIKQIKNSIKTYTSTINIIMATRMNSAR